MVYAKRFLLRTTKLQLLVETFNDKKINKITIFTLNHDLVIEGLISQLNMKFENGFSSRKGRYGYFNTNRFSYSKERINYIKLHGSVNWQRYSHNKIEMFESNNYNSIYEDNPVFLIGTFNKIFDYTNNDIFFCFIIFSILN